MKGSFADLLQVGVGWPPSTDPTWLSAFKADLRLSAPALEYDALALNSSGSVVGTLTS